MAHTPGPWHRNIPPAWKYPVVFAGRNTHVAVLARSSNREDAEDNINLIAAAPELLEALEAAKFMLDTGNTSDYAFDLIDAALARAKGGPVSEYED